MLIQRHEEPSVARLQSYTSFRRIIVLSPDGNISSMGMKASKSPEHKNHRNWKQKCSYSYFHHLISETVNSGFFDVAFVGVFSIFLNCEF